MKKIVLSLMLTLPLSARVLKIDEMEAYYDFAKEKKLLQKGKKIHPFYKLAKYFSDLITEGKRDSSTDAAKIITAEEARNLSDTLVKMFAEGYGWWGGFSKTESIKEDTELCAISALETLSAMATEEQRELFKQTPSDKEYLSRHYAVVDSFMTVGKLYNESHESSTPLKEIYEDAKKSAPDYLAFVGIKKSADLSTARWDSEKLFIQNKYRPFYAGQLHSFLLAQYNNHVIPRINLSQMEEITDFALKLIPWDKGGTNLGSHKEIINILFSIKEKGEINRLWKLLDTEKLIPKNDVDAKRVIKIFAKNIPHEKWAHFAGNAHRLLTVVQPSTAAKTTYIHLFEPLAEIPDDQWDSVVDESLLLLNKDMIVDDQAAIVKALGLLSEVERRTRVDALIASLDATNADYVEKVLETLA